MALNGNTRPDVDQVLRGLKDFQRDTVEYVFRRLYLDPHPTSRFLIADEVGLGKTLVARGVIAKAIDHLWDTTERIDVVYICSNQEIARQNIDRLNITADRHFQFASRSTLLPVTLQALRGNKLNFVSLTPGTSFDLQSYTGLARERAMLFFLLWNAWGDGLSKSVLGNVLRAGIKPESWKYELRQFQAAYPKVQKPALLQIDPELAVAFCGALTEHPELEARYERLAGQIGSRKTKLPLEVRRERDRLIRDLRHLLARSSLSALEPDLVILDEFQRFKSVLEPEDELAALAKKLLAYPGVKVLLLSATPYKMVTLDGEIGEDHYQDFLRTVSFLLEHAPEQVELLKGAIAAYRRALFDLSPGGQAQGRAARHTMEQVLRQVMVRTERLAASADRNGMLTERVTAREHLQASDLHGFVRLDRIAHAVDGGDQMEYWKSAAYPLNLMEDYKLKRKLREALENGESNGLDDLLASAEPTMLSRGTFQAFQPVDPANARLRALLQDTVDTGNWRLLWLPPSLPYTTPGGPFASVESSGLTKALVFSSWRLAPKAIAILASYEAERRMVDDPAGDYPYDELGKRRKPLLRFNRSDGRLAGMPLFCLTYPCLALARLVDPLAIAVRLADGDLPTAGLVLQAVEAQVDQFLGQLAMDLPAAESGREDERWYWAALALLDRHFQAEEAGNWLTPDEPGLAWATIPGRSLEGAGKLRQGGGADAQGPTDALPDSEDERESPTAVQEDATGFLEHVQEFARFFKQPEPLGRRPEDLTRVLALIALASPAVTALRALLRTVPGAQGAHQACLAGAARIGLGFRTLFNRPESILLIERSYEDGPYWLKALAYARDGNLQSVLDEYCHVLVESLGLVGHSPDVCAARLGAAVEQALTLRAPTLRFDEIRRLDGQWVIDSSDSRERPGIRCRYALRFGEEKRSDDDQSTRHADVRMAFNSPFRPFILATTSIGQEGLDFHQYCHRVVHWNLPSNPVDLEQREGRVHRYKGHVIRRNLARHYGLAAVQAGGEGLEDPWRQLFERAVQERPAGSNDLRPFWIYETEGGVAIERTVPVLPLSRELAHLAQLKRSVVAYRSVIGQPRQQELLEYLTSQLSPEELSHVVDEFAIDLSPLLGSQT